MSRVASGLLVFVRSSRISLLRLFAVLVAVNLLTQLFAWLYPVQYDLETAWERYGRWDTSAPIESAPADGARSTQDFGGNVILAANWTGYLVGSWEGMATVQAWVTSTNGRYYPEVTVVGREEIGKDWIDIDISAARQLDLSPGDTAGFVLSEDKVVDLRVRNVYAVKMGYPTPTVVVPSESIFPEMDDDPKDEFKNMTEILVSGMSVDEVEKVLATPFYRDRFLAGGYYPDEVDVKTLGVESRAERLARAEEQSSANLKIIAAVSLLSALALVGMVLRELAVFMSGAARAVETMHRIGCPRRQLWTVVAVLAFAVAGLGLAVGALSAVAAFRAGITGATFPPTLMPTFLSVNAAILLALAAAVAAYAGFVRKGSQH